MNEITLSNSLPIIETEIRQFQNLAGESIFEIGRRLKHVKENDLAHGEFGKWLESINMDRRRSSEFIKVFDELADSNVRTSGQLGSKVLYEIATLPESERTKEHVTSKGETKTPDEMTVREIQELKRQLKRRNEENDILQKQLEQAENKPPEVIERYTEPERIEVIPDDYDYIKGNYESAISLRDRYKKQLEEMRVELESSRSVVSSDGSQYESLKAREEQLKNKISSYEKLYDLQSQLELVLSKIHLKTHSLKLENTEHETEIVNELGATLDEVIKVCENLKIKLLKKESL